MNSVHLPVHILFPILGREEQSDQQIHLEVEIARLLKYLTFQKRLLKVCFKDGLCQILRSSIEALGVLDYTP